MRSGLFLPYFSIPQKCLWRPLKRTLRHANEFRKRFKLFFLCPIDDDSKILWKPINPFHATGLPLYPHLLWTWKIIWFSDLFRWCRKKLATWNCLRHSYNWSIIQWSITITATKECFGAILISFVVVVICSIVTPKWRLV